MYIIGDIHLGKVQDTIEKNGYPSRATDAMMRVSEVIMLASETKEPVVLAGDVFDSSHPSPWMIGLIIQIFKMASRYEVELYVIPGNHDCGVKWDSMSFMVDSFPKVHIFNEPTFLDIGPWKVLLLPHVPRQKMEEYVAKYESYAGYVRSHGINKVDVIVGHAHVTGAKNASDVELEAGDALHFDHREYPPFNVAVFGHIHKHQSLKNNKIVYTGPVVTNSFDEAEIEKGFIHVYWNNTSEALEWKFFLYTMPETSYKHLVIDLISKDTIDLSEAKLKPLVINKLVKVSVYARDPMQIDMQSIRTEIDRYGKVVRFETVIAQDIAEIETLETDDMFSEVNFLEVFKDWVGDKELLTQKQKRMALTAAMEIIEEVQDAERTTA